MFKILSEPARAEARLALALGVSVLLHLSLFLRADFFWHDAPASRGSLTVSLSNKAANEPAPESGGAPPPGAAPVDTVVPRAAGSGTADAPPAPATSPRSQTAPDASGESRRNVTYFTNAAMSGGVAEATAGLPGFQNPAYVVADKLAPRPELPDSFHVAYPDAAKAGGLKATVKIAVLIDETGRVIDATGMDDSGETAVLVSAAVQALRGVRFVPGQSQGKPVKSKALVSVRFGFE